MISIKNAKQLDKMREAGRLLHEVLTALRPMVVPGATTRQLDKAAFRMITQAGAKPSFLGYEKFPASICTSVNERVVHGIPDDKPLREGDILGVDCGVILDGWQSDSAFTAPVGNVSDEAKRLMAATEDCFWQAALSAVPGNRVTDIGRVVEQTAHGYGYEPIHDLCGHGIGRKMHEDPEVFNFVDPQRKEKGSRLQPGMTLAIEPMIAAGGWQVDIDGWDVRTRDRKLCSHYEHTVLVTHGLPEILSLPDALVPKELRDMGVHGFLPGETGSPPVEAVPMRGAT